MRDYPLTTCQYRHIVLGRFNKSLFFFFFFFLERMKLKNNQDRKIFGGRTKKHTSTECVFEAISVSMILIRDSQSISFFKCREETGQI